MNILIVTGIFPPDIGGPATYVPAIGREFVKRGHKVSVVTLSDALGRDDVGYPFAVVRLRRGAFKPLRVMRTIGALLRQGRKADVLFVNGLYLESVIANFVLGKPLVQKLVGDWAWERAVNKGWMRDNFEQFQTSRYSSKIEALKRLRKFWAKRADKVITPSRYLARWICDWGVPEKKVNVVYNGVEHLPFSPCDVPLSTQVNLITVGRLVPLKQIDRIIKAVAEHDDVGLVIVGDGPERSCLEELTHRKGLSRRIYFAGQKNKEETLSLMAACDVFVLNSVSETFPHVVLEAMSIGIPVVATAVGGTPEVVRHQENGLLVAPHGGATLSKILPKVLASPLEMQILASRAKKTVEQFRFSEMVEATEAILQNRAH
ncbi:MAG TPA: glycosyltransferase family 4 protein [Candidatus Acidoferrales bacterium]|nr:glycosyltransferase family 4 protein [Candidatus Acidoferrales bacterium]